jgi:hypothetical protein
MSSTSCNQGTIERHTCLLGWIGFIALGSILPSALFGQSKVRLSPPRVVDQSIVIPRADLNLDHVRTLAKKFLQEHDAKSATLLRLLMVPDEVSRANNLIHGLPDSTYASTVGLIRRAGGLLSGPLARLLVVNGGAKLSYLDHGALIEETLSGASEQTTIRDGIYSYELLHFRLTKPGPALRADKYFLNIYLKASPNVSVSSCVRVFQTLRQRMNVELSVNVRSDSWFMEDDQYPLIPAFTKPLRIPTEFEYIIAQRLSCSPVREKVRCSGQNFFP